MSGLAATEVGDGRRVVFVHGTLSHGTETFARQLRLADGWRLVLVDRPGYGDSPAELPNGLDDQARFIGDALADGADLVGHSYGGVVCLLAAVRRPEAVRSLTVIEPPALGLVRLNPDVEAFIDVSTEPWRHAGGWPPERLREAFLGALGFRAAAPLSEVGRRDVIASFREPPPHTAEIPLDRLASLRLQVLVVTGGWPGGATNPARALAARAIHSVSDVLIRGLAAQHAHFPAAHHNPQLLGAEFNEVLRAFVERE